jgi:hypothetical protein
MANSLLKISNEKLWVFSPVRLVALVCNAYDMHNKNKIQFLVDFFP